jgi:hypothetical protein
VFSFFCLDDSAWQIRELVAPYVNAFPSASFYPDKRPVDLLKLNGEGNNTARLLQRKKLLATKAIIIDGSSPSPTVPPANLPFAQKEQVDLVRELFEKRPIWSRKALKTQLPTAILANFNNVLPYIAYFVTSGPWRNLWIRYNCDPKDESNKGLRIYQSFDFRFPHQNQELKSLTDNLNLGPEKTGSYKFCLREPPHKRQSVYQLVDIHDVAIQRILAEAAYPSVYDKKYGWFCQETLNLVRQKMKNIFEYSFRKDEGYSTITGETSQQAENDVLKSLFSESCHEGKGPYYSLLN